MGARVQGGGGVRCADGSAGGDVHDGVSLEEMGGGDGLFGTMRRGVGVDGSRDSDTADGEEPSDSEEQEKVKSHSSH